MVFVDPDEVRGERGDGPSSDVQVGRTPLPFAQLEARFISETFGPQNVKIFAGPSASRDNVLALDWRQFDVAHFATHAVFRNTHPELSGLVLARGSGPAVGPRGTDKTSLLSFHDVLQMEAPLQLADLSACASGKGPFVQGEGKLALDNAFLAVGASRVISTLWPVDDQASSVFMREFYRSLAINRSPMLSLQQARKKMAESEEWGAPYYWGAFTLSGDWHPIPK